MILKLENDSRLTSYPKKISKRFLGLLLCVLCVFEPICSEADPPDRRNQILLEALGAGGYYSINYHRVFFKNNNTNLSARVGLSSYHVRDFTNRVNPDLIIPTGLQLAIGKQHQLTTGLGNTFSSIVKAKGSHFEPTREWNLNGYILLGYRFSHVQSGLFFGIAYTPLLEEYEEFRHWGTVEVGISF